MKIITLIFLLASTTQSLWAGIVKSKSVENINRHYVRSCLSAIYTAEKSFHAQWDDYSNDPEEIGLASLDCDRSVISISSYSANFFEAYARIQNENWMINSQKELRKVE
jgi:hypothetical protein